MKMNLLKKLTIASVLALAVSPAVAHESNMGGMGMSGMNMSAMMGMHDMAATVTALDPTTGMVEVNAGGMALKVHFPPTSLSTVKVGDKITLHLAFTKP